MSIISTLSPTLLAELRAAVGSENVIEGGESLDTLSKDFFWYSPVLRRLLDDKIAAAAVRVSTLEQLRSVISACCIAKVPIVARGAGTGNYGQCVPVHGGVVVDMTPFDRILAITDEGVIRAEPGARMGTIETQARARGWELRCMPSTWVKSSFGGFFCGGSGGIGSLIWGGITGPGNVKSVTLMSCEPSPRLVRLEEEAANPSVHAYGTNGIMVEIEMRLAPKMDYEQLIVSSPDWQALFDWTDAIVHEPRWPKRLVSQFENPIPSFFKPLQRYFRAGEHVSFFVLDRRFADEVVTSAQKAGFTCVFRKPLSDPPKPPYITDYTFNHTSLWAINADPGYTYIQARFGPNYAEQFRALKAKFHNEIFFHMSWWAHGVKRSALSGHSVGDQIDAGGLPIVRFVSEERLNELLRFCAEIGVLVNNPHTYILEEGGWHPDIEAKRSLKESLDPLGLLNPGKMKTFPLNPFSNDVVLAGAR